MTSGEYIKYLIAAKSISVSELCEAAGIKSRNTVYRLFNNYHSEAKTRELIKSIKPFLSLTKSELKTLDELLNEKRVSNVLYRSREILLPMLFDIHSEKRGKPDSLDITIPENGRSGDRKIFLSQIDRVELIAGLYEYVKETPGAEIVHYMSMDTNDVMTAYDILGILLLSSTPGYTPLITSKPPVQGVEMLRMLNKDRRLFKLEDSEKGDICVETAVSRNLYDFILKRHESAMASARAIKRSTSMVKDYISVVNDSLELDKGHTYYFEGAPCFGNLGFELMYRMFKDANYFGFPPEHPYVNRLIELIKTRNDIFANDPTSKKSFVFDEKHIREMLKTGFAFEHVKPFRPLTVKERVEYFSKLIKVAKEMPDKLRIRFIKEGEIKFPFVYGPGRLLYVNYSDTPYFEGYSIMTKEKSVIRIMDDFAEYVWNKFTISDEESISKLEKMMDTYL